MVVKQMNHEIYIDAKISTQEIEDEFANADPFNKSWDEVAKYRGINKNFKRRETRKAAQIPRGNDGKVSSTYLQEAKAVQRGNKAESKTINPGTVYRNGYGVFDVITPPYNLYELSAYYDTSFANHAAIDAKVSNTVGVGYKFEITSATQMKMESISSDSARDKAKKRIEQLKIELGVWLEGLNEDEGLTKILEKVIVDMQATGNGYIEVGRTTAGDIGYIGHVPATTMRVRRLRDGYMQIIAGTVVYFRNFGAKNANPVTEDPNPNEIIHLKEYSPLNTFYGVPDIVAAIVSMRGDMLAAQYNLDYFENKAVPRYIITVKGAKLSGEAEDRLFRFFQTGLKGQNHRTLYIPLPGDQDGQKIEFDMHPIEAGVQEASFNQYRLSNRDDVLMAHQVPLSKLGGSDSGGVAAAMSQDRTFRDQVAKPLQEYVSKAVNKILREKTDVVELVFNEISLIDEVAQSQIHERYTKTTVLTPNEVREKIGYPQREGGDEPLVLTGKEQADLALEQADKQAEVKMQTQQATIDASRERDAERLRQQSDGPAAVTGRNPKGSGPKTS
jgi:PBSX family phage portal protein